MAAFNPEVTPVGEQTWDFRPITTPQANVTVGTALKGIGDTVGRAIEATDLVEQHVVKNETEKKAQGIRDDYISELQKTSAALRPDHPQVDANGVPVPVPFNILTASAEAPIPQDIQSVAQQAQTLVSSKANGKISESYYYAKLDGLAKDMRARFPGYREYIDKEISEVTGVSPANAVVRGLIGDINAAATAANAGQNKAMALVEQYAKELPGVDWSSVARDVQSGKKNIADVIQMGAGPMKQKIQWQWEASGLAAMEGERKYREEKATEAVNGDAGREVSNFVNLWQTNAGIKGPAQIRDWMARVQSGQALTTDEEATQMGMLWAQHRNDLAARMWARYNAVPDGTDNDPKSPYFGKPLPSAAAILGQEKTKALINASLSGMDDISNNFKDQHFGLAFANQNLWKAIGDDTLMKMRLNPEFAAWSDVYKAVATVHGTQAMNSMTERGLAKGLPATIGTFTDSYTKALASQTSRNPNISTTPDPRVPKGEVTTVKDAIQTGSQTPALNDPRTYNTIIDNVVHGISDKGKDAFPDQIRNNFADSVFAPRNQGMFSLIAPDTRDDKTGQIIPGKFSKFAEIFQPKVIDAVKELSRSDPNKFAQMRDMAKISFAKDLLPGELGNLTSIGGNPYLRMGWDTKGQIVLETNPPKDNNPTEIANYYSAGVQDSLKQAQFTVKKINMGLGSLSNIAIAENTTVEPYFLEILKATGYSGPLMGAIASAVTKPQPSTK